MSRRKAVSVGIFFVLIWSPILCGQGASIAPLRVTLTPLKTRYKVMEPWLYEIRIENVSSDTLRIADNIHSHYLPKVIDSEGRAIIWVYEMSYALNYDESNTIKLAPGYFYGEKCSWSGLQKTGEYSFHIDYVAPQNHGGSLPHYWYGTCESNTVQIIVE